MNEALRVATFSVCRSGELSDADHLVNFLQILLAESINGHDKMLSAQIREVLRCLTVFDDKGYVPLSYRFLSYQTLCSAPILSWKLAANS